MVRLVLQALEPASVEASLLVASDLQAERAMLEQHWQQRLERARYIVDRPVANTSRNRRTGWWADAGAGMGADLGRTGAARAITNAFGASACKDPDSPSWP